MNTSNLHMNVDQAFTRFVKEAEPRLSYALAAAYGPEVGAEVTADALAWAWENWGKVCGMENPIGYLYRVGQSKARWYHRPRILFPQLPLKLCQPTHVVSTATTPKLWRLRPRYLLGRTVRIFIEAVVAIGTRPGQPTRRPPCWR